jgi:hypothetical protein
MVDICCVGHITSDKVVTSNTTLYMPGGTAYYFSFPLAGFDVNYLLVTALAKAEHRYVAELEHRNIAVKVQESEQISARSTCLRKQMLSSRRP